MTFDPSFYPHVLDLILDSATSNTLRALRLTNRSIQDLIDRRIAKHVLYIDWCNQMCTTEGQVCLAFTEPTVAERIRTLDVYPPDAGQYNPVDRKYTDDQEGGVFCDFPFLRFNLPNLQTVRLLGADEHCLLTDICDPPETVIQLVHPGRFIPRLYVGESLGPRTRKCIAVLPTDSSTVRTSWVSWAVEQEEAFQEKVLVFLPELDEVTWGGYGGVSGSPWMTLDRWEGEDDPASITVVGWEGVRRFFLFRDRYPEDHLLGFLTDDGDDFHLRKIRFLTLEEWKDELTHDEWNSVASLPEALRLLIHLRGHR